MSKESERLKRMLAELQNIRDKAESYGYSNEISVSKVLRWLNDLEHA